MKRKFIIQKIIFLAAWLLVIAGITTLLIAANRKHATRHCKDVVVQIRAAGDNACLEEKDIVSQLERAAGLLIHQPIQGLSLADLELALLKNSWIRKAELYFSREDVLHVVVEEREPVARIFTTQGYSFYMDSSGQHMPLIPGLDMRVPVITGYPATLRKNSKDSTLLEQVKQVASFICHHPFWNAQTGQIDITSERDFEIIPVIGDHVIRLGKAENIEEKLQRLMVFYKRILAKSGFSKYEVIDLRFNGQVVGVHRGPASPVDSALLQKNINELLERGNLRHLTSDMLPATASRQDTINRQNFSVPVKTNPTPDESPEPVQQKQDLQSRSVKTNESQPKVPRAVMRGPRG